MDFIKGLTGQPKPAGKTDESTSLLSDWNTYSGSKTDVESGSLGPSTSTALRSNVDAAGTTLANFFQDSFTKVTTNVQTGVSTVQQTVSTSAETFSLPSGQQLVYFFSFLGGGCVFLLLAFTLFLPTIILSPSKFALSFTLGCLGIMGGFTVLRGWRTQLAHMMSRERLPFSSAYVGSVAATLYAALILHSYLLCLLCSGLQALSKLMKWEWFLCVQVVALMYYLMSYFPGGAAGVKVMLSLFYKAAMQCFGAVSSTVLK